MLKITPIKFEDGRLFLLDQRKLPREEIYVEIKTADEIREAITDMVVRGAPAIGVAAAFGLCVATKDSPSEDVENFVQEVASTAHRIKAARPTAVNLAWAMDRMTNALNKFKGQADSGSVTRAKELLFKEAEEIRREDEEACLRIGEFGLSLLKRGDGVMTYCNAGALATAGYGTSLASLHLGTERDYEFDIYTCETRPLLQGARLTAWELEKSGACVTLVCDNMAATLMAQGRINAIVAGCDRMTAKGYGANKIGTMGLAILAKNFDIPFYMFLPTSTIDLSLKDGREIVIEEREGDEIRSMWYKEDMAPKEVETYNPAFDVTPPEYITAIITERGIIYPPYDINIPKIMESEE